MNALRGWMIVALVLAATNARAACSWPAWEQFKQDYISDGGRVIDPSDARKISTSEGQSYALFFALAANDRKAFDLLLNWTSDNLAQGSLSQHLPAWLWGKKDADTWAVIDKNSASDADIWIAWSLLEAGRLWKAPQYTATGKALLKRIASEEVIKVPGLGLMLLPGNVGLPRRKPGALTPAISRRNWRIISPALARRGQRFARQICVCCWKPRQKDFHPTGCSISKIKAGNCSQKKTLLAVTTRFACISGRA